MGIVGLNPGICKIVKKSVSLLYYVNDLEYRNSEFGYRSYIM